MVVLGIRFQIPLLESDVGVKIPSPTPHASVHTVILIDVCFPDGLYSRGIACSAVDFLVCPDKTCDPTHQASMFDPRSLPLLVIELADCVRSIQGKR